MQYDWIDFTQSLLLNFFLLKLMKDPYSEKYAVYDAAGISVPKLESGDEIIDIDPFTIFEFSIKGITNANRIAILEVIASVFRISATVPSNLMEFSSQ